MTITVETRVMRVNCWLQNLRAVVNEYKEKPFVWGENDCCLFAARCIDAMTGSDWVADLGEHYWDKKTALAYIAAEGGIENPVTARLGEPVSKMQARRGDVCMVNTPEGHGMGICLGAMVVVPGPTGLVNIPLSDAIRAWRIG